MKYALTWLVMAVAIAVGIGSLNWASYRRLAARGVSAQAKVVELLPNNHNTVRYEYRVAGRTFQGRMQSWQPNPPREQLRIGQQLVIYYNPDQPGESVLGDPTPILKNESISIGLAAVVFPSMTLVAWAWRESRNRANRRVFT